MENVGINVGFLVVQLFNVFVLLGWPILSVIALFDLRRRELTTMVATIWVLIILLIPFLGAISFWIMRPSEKQ